MPHTLAQTLQDPTRVLTVDAETLPVIRWCAAEALRRIQGGR